MVTPAYVLLSPGLGVERPAPLSPRALASSKPSEREWAGNSKAQSTGSDGRWRAAAAGACLLAGAVRGGTRRATRRGRAHCALSARPAPTALRAAAGGAVDEASPLRIIIAGGGVGGLVAAKAFSTVPTLKVEVLEQASQFARFGGPIQLASNALSVIRDIDETLFNELMEHFTFTGYRRNGLVDALRTEWFCPFDAMKSAAEMFELPYTGVVDRPDLQSVLLKSLPEGTVTNSSRVSSYEILPNNGGVRVRLEDGSEKECDVFIGADGIWSATRAQMWGEAKKGPGSGCTYSGYTVFAGETVYRPEDYFDVGYKVYMGPKRYFVCSDVGRGRIQWYAFCGVPEGTELPASPDGKKDYVLSSFLGWSQQINDLVEATPAQAIEDRALYDRPPSFFRSWADGPVALMGDACHPMMPNLGQGGCQAMEDGYVLMQKLSAVKHRSEVPAALQDYYGERILRSAAVQFLSRIASDLLLDTFTFPWKPSEGLSAPHGKGRGDFNYNSVLINYLRYLLPPIFNLQFSFLYSMHPYKWTADEVKALVDGVMDRHRENAHAAWEKREKQVERGEADAADAAMPSFFAAVAATAE